MYKGASHLDLRRRRSSPHESRISSDSEEEHTGRPTRQCNSRSKNSEEGRHTFSNSHSETSKLNKRRGARSTSRSRSCDISHRRVHRHHKAHERDRGKSPKRYHRSHGAKYDRSSKRSDEALRRGKHVSRSGSELSHNIASSDKSERSSYAEKEAKAIVKEDDASALLSICSDQSDVNIGMLNSEFRELNYSRAYGIDVSSFAFVQPDILNVDLPRETKELSAYERRQRRKQEIMNHPDRFWKCKKCESMNYLSCYECTRCKQLRNANH